LGAFLDYANDWKEFVREFGEPEEVSWEALSDFDPNRVWSLWFLRSRDTEFLCNEIAVDDEVMSYWVTPRPWTQPQGTQTVTMLIWVSCPKCEEESDEELDWDPGDCEECEGFGNVAIHMPDCVNAKTDEEVWAARQSWIALRDFSWRRGSRWG
jgi:hypothetical protein